MAAVIHYRRDDILALTLEEFQQAIRFVEGRKSGGG
jgi:hypothetical protein